MAKKYYAVRKGKTVGILTSWPECQASVSGFKGAEYKSFVNLNDAKDYMAGGQGTSNTPLEIEDGVLIAYCDGSFVLGSGYSYGLVILDKDENLVYEENGVGTDMGAATMRNVAGEILGAERVVEYARANNVKIVIHYDYQGIESWATGDWKTNNEYTKKYADYMKANKDVFRFKKVKGHSNCKWNDYVDMLAKKALGIA